MKNKPILFSTDMVKALLAGTKTQTRRIIKLRDGSPARSEDISTNEDGKAEMVMDFSRTFPYWEPLKPPAGPGDLLWVRETFSIIDNQTVFRADFPIGYQLPEGGKWKPSIFMPWQHSRIHLRVTEVRIEELVRISEIDAIKEGIPNGAYAVNPVASFERLWTSIHGKDSWQEDIWVWAYSFEIYFVKKNNKPSTTLSRIVG